MNKPVVTIKNQASRAIYIDGDPNWDDQVLKINDKPLAGVYQLAKDKQVTVSVDWDGPGDAYMMGVIFADGPNYDNGEVGFYQLTIGQDSATGNLDVTDTDKEGQPLEHYTIADQTAWSMTMVFVDH